MNLRAVAVDLFQATLLAAACIVVGVFFRVDMTAAYLMISLGKEMLRSLDLVSGRKANPDWKSQLFWTLAYSVVVAVVGATAVAFAFGSPGLVRN